jgi:membrane fusion protein (multidrug efflux system)
MSGAALDAGLAAPRPRAARRPRLRVLAVLACALAACGAGAAYIIIPGRFATTDDAYLRADVSTIAPRLRGLVSEVAVRDNQHVRAGDILVRIDPEEYQARLAAARAELDGARASVHANIAALAKLDAEQRLADANVRVSRSAIMAADAETIRAGLDRARFEHLAVSGAVTRREADTVRATAISAHANADRSRAALDVSIAQQAVTAGRRAELLAAIETARAGVAKAEGALDLARQDADHAVIRAPVDGIIGDRQVQAGDYVQPGTRMMSVVPMQTLYVSANFKETQVARMYPGQRAEVFVDALGGGEITGEVESIAPGSGSQFALLPFEPGTGNFTKIVQRVAVRIRFAEGLKREDLRPGLSAVVRVDTSVR